MSVDKIIRQIDDLEIEAKKIENEIQALFNKADIENNPSKRVQISFGPDEIPTLGGMVRNEHAFISQPAENRWKALSPNLKDQQQILIRKYQKWYSQSYVLVHEFAIQREEEFKKYCEKSSSEDGILSTLKFENKFIGPVDKQKILDKIINDFATQQEILLAIKVTLLLRESNKRKDEPKNILDFLQSRVRPAIMKKPEFEKDVQDVVEQILIGYGLTKGRDYDREVGRVKVSSKEVIPDFIFPKLGLALEIKFFKTKSQRSALIDQINSDIQAYGKTYATVAFLIYDLGHIRDEVEFKQGLENQENVFILIVKQ
jgi:hypothetical protein